MSRQSMEWLNENILVGYVAKRGDAWWRDDRWDGFQNHFDDAIPLDRAVEFFGRWEPIEADLFFYDRDGKVRGDSQGAKTIYRSQPGSKYDYTRMGNHEQTYQIHSRTEWLIDNLSDILDTNDLGIASVGEVDLGRVAWVQVEAPDTIEHPSGESYRPFIAATTSLDGSLATTYRAGATRIVCDNTRDAFFAGSGGKYKIRHTLNSTQSYKIHDAREALEIIFKVSEEYQREMETLLGTPFDDSMWSKFMDLYVPVPEATSEGRTTKGGTIDNRQNRGVTMAENKRQALTALWMADERVTPWKGTAWGALQATNTYNQHVATAKKIAARQERQWSNFLTGTTEKQDVKAMESINAVIAQGPKVMTFA